MNCEFDCDCMRCLPGTIVTRLLAVACLLVATMMPAIAHETIRPGTEHGPFYHRVNHTGKECHSFATEPTVPARGMGHLLPTPFRRFSQDENNVAGRSKSTLLLL